MYGLKRVEYDSIGHVSAIEFYPEISEIDIALTMKALGLKLNLEQNTKLKQRLAEYSEVENGITQTSSH